MFFGVTEKYSFQSVIYPNPGPSLMLVGSRQETLLSHSLILSLLNPDPLCNWRSLMGIRGQACSFSLYLHPQATQQAWGVLTGCDMVCPHIDLGRWLWAIGAGNSRVMNAQVWPIREAVAVGVFHNPTGCWLCERHGSRRTGDGGCQASAPNQGYLTQETYPLHS